MYPGVAHPRFDRISRTKYAFSEDLGPSRYVVHIGQVMEYINFDQFLRNGNNIFKDTEIPIGYEKFAESFNGGALQKDRRRFTTFLPMDRGPYTIWKPAERCVTLADFKIRPEDCNTGSTNLFGMTEEQAAMIVGQFATTQAKQNMQRTKFAEQRIEKRESGFRRHNNPPPDRNKPKPYQRNQPQHRRYFDAPPGDASQIYHTPP